jgi:UDP-N-acetylglucosamine acyltransferase
VAANEIHPTAVIDGDVQIGSGNVIGAFCVLEGPLMLGDNNQVGPHAVIGTRGDEIWQRRYDTTGKRVTIGSRCTVREHTTVHKPCYGELTVLGDDVYLMPGAYVAHDTQLHDGAILAQNTVIGGVSRVLEKGYLASGAVLHQHAVLGHYAIVGAAAAAVRCVRPFSRFVPGQPVTVNAYAIERHGFGAQREEIEHWVLERTPPTSDRLAAMAADYERLRDEGGRGEY